MGRHRLHRRRPVRRVTDASRGLERARRAAGLSRADVGRALGLHPRTVGRWERGESRPNERLWPRLLAFYASRAPETTQALAVAVGREVPAAQASAPDTGLLNRVVAEAADALDVAPKRVRDVLRAAARAATEAGVGFDALMRASVLDAARESRADLLSPNA